MSEDTGWLIEHPHDPRYGCASFYFGKDGFTIDSLQAVRFARKEDAVREIDRFQSSLAKSLIPAQHSWIPARVCAHEQLARQCEICKAQEEAAHWRAKAEDSFEPIRKIADALAEGGFHCHAKPGFVADHVPSMVNEAVTELKIKREECKRLRQANESDVRRLSDLWDNEKVLRERAEIKSAECSAELDSAKIAASDTLARHNHLRDTWRLIGESLREFGYEPIGEDHWVKLVHCALVELDQRRGQRTSDTNLLVELLATPDDATEDTEWLILHARLEQFLSGTGERGLKNLLGTVTMLRDRLLDIGTNYFNRAINAEMLDGCLLRVQADKDKAS